MSIEIFYNEEGTSYTSYSSHSRRPRSSPVHDYALSLNVSSDGCRTRQDVDYRSQMLKSVVRAYDENRLKPPKAWVSW